MMPLTRWRVLGTLTLACVLLAGCGGGSDSADQERTDSPTTAVGGDTETETETETETGGGAAAPDDSSQSSGSPGEGAAGSASEPGGSNGPSGSSDDGQPLTGEPDGPTGIVTSVTPNCAGLGTPVEVVIETDPLADVSYAASFSDDSNHNLFGLTQADLEGRFVWNFVVPIDAATGDADLIIVSGHPDTGAKKGRGTLRVTENGQCP